MSFHKNNPEPTLIIQLYIAQMKKKTIFPCKKTSIKKRKFIVTYLDILVAFIKKNWRVGCWWGRSRG